MLSLQEEEYGKQVWHESRWMELRSCWLLSATPTVFVFMERMYLRALCRHSDQEKEQINVIYLCTYEFRASTTRAEAQ